MKTIEFENKSYEVEDWVNWVAKDSDGEIWVFEAMPVLDEDYDWDTGGKKSDFLAVSDHYAGWHRSLVKV